MYVVPQHDFSVPAGTINTYTVNTRKLWTQAMTFKVSNVHEKQQSPRENRAILSNKLFIN